MKYNDYVSLNEINKYDELIDNDDLLPSWVKSSQVLREVCRAGIFLRTNLMQLECPEELMNRIQFTAGKLSFGRDPWDVHYEIIKDYINNKLVFEDDGELKN